MPSIADAAWPLQRAAEPESRRENALGSSQVAAPPLPASSSLNLLARTSASMPPIADRASKRQRNSVGGGGRQLTTIAAAPPQVALDPAVVVPADIERNREAIVAGVAPPRKLSADEKKQRASIVSQLAADFNAFKNSLGDGRSNQYGADKRLFRSIKDKLTTKRSSARTRTKKNTARPNSRSGAVFGR